MSQDDANSQQIHNLLQQAKQGHNAALEQLLHWSREFLRREARETLAPQLRVRVDESDLVQKVCLAAFQQFGDFRGESEAEYIQWLRRILQRDILEVVDRERHAAKRAVDREVPASEPLRKAIGRQTSPSRRAMRQEERVLIQKAIDELPDDQRTVMRLKHIDHVKLSEIAARMGVTEDVVTGLLYRGMKQLKPILQKLGFEDS